MADDLFTFNSVPVVDFSQLQNPSTKERALAELRNAIFVVGFLYLTNTGLEVISFPIPQTVPSARGLTGP